MYLKKKTSDVLKKTKKIKKKQSRAKRNEKQTRAGAGIVEDASGKDSRFGA